MRKDARLAFLRRFIESLELALSKLDAIVIGTSSSLGRAGTTSSTQSCVACDRPLRMRITSTPLHKLQSKLIQNQELSPRTKRKKIQTQLQSSIGTPSFHSNVHTTTRVGKKKGEEIAGIDTLQKKNEGNQSSKLLGIDYFADTILDPTPPVEGNETMTDENVDGVDDQPNEQQLQQQSPQQEGETLTQSQSTSALANELRNLVKLSASNNLITSPSSTAMMGYSKSQSKLQTKRPKSAGCASVSGMNSTGNGNKVLKSTQITYQGNTTSIATSTGTTATELTPKYVKKGGFKMRVNRTMPQEKLVESITSSTYSRDISFPSPSNQSKDSAGAFLPSPDIKKIKPIDLIPPTNESSVEELNLSSYCREKE
mgnify:CR=1 FL=1